MSDPAGRPVPVPDETSAPFWAAAAAGVLALARCAACGAATHPPAPVCPSCGSTEPAWRFEPVAGIGVVRSWTVLRRPFLPGFAEDLPIVLVDVAVDVAVDGALRADGSEVRLVGRLLDPPPGALEPSVPAGPSIGPLSIGAAVAFDVERLGDGVAVPAFRLGAGS